MQETNIAATLPEALDRYSKAVRDLVGFGLQQGNIVGSLGEILACKAMGLTPATSNTKGYDATADNGKKYQIKTRVSVPGRAIQLGAVRDLKAADYILAVILSVDMQVLDAWQIPAEVFVRHARRSQHTNSWLLTLRSNVLSEPSVANIKRYFL